MAIEAVNPISDAQDKFTLLLSWHQNAIRVLAEAHQSGNLGDTHITEFLDMLEDQAERLYDAYSDTLRVSEPATVGSA